MAADWRITAQCARPGRASMHEQAVQMVPVAVPLWAKPSRRRLPVEQPSQRVHSRPGNIEAVNEAPRDHHVPPRTPLLIPGFCLGGRSVTISILQ